MAWQSHRNERPESPPDAAAVGATTRQVFRLAAILREIVRTLLLAVLIFMAVRSVVLTYRVDGVSMEPTLEPAQLLLVNRWAYRHLDIDAILDRLPLIERGESGQGLTVDPPQRGEIVILHPPGGGGEPYVKRVVGLPGEHLLIRNGTVYVDGEPLVEPYLNDERTWWAGLAGRSGVRIPEGYVFVLGDNRRNSMDSRSFGPVPIDQVVGKVWLSLWPPDTIGRVSHDEAGG